MNQDQGKRRATRWAQAFVLLLATFCLLLLPRGAWAEDQPPPTEPETRELPPSSPKLAPKQRATETPSEREPESSPEPSDPPSRPKLEVQRPKVSQAPSAVTVKSLPTGENKTGVSAQSISVPKGPGTIEGMGESFSAQASTGIATFSVPFALPAARGDAQPSLGLSYSSASGSGVAGVGWSVGVPFIARETDRGLPGYEDASTWHARQDRFVYNGGQELVPVTVLLPGEQLPAWAGAGWQLFRPRVEGSYLRFFWNPSARLWRVQDKSGVILELGVVGGETDAIETAPGQPPRCFAGTSSARSTATATRSAITTTFATATSPT